jgi:membrane-bound lytic murein transglycosylase D
MALTVLARLFGGKKKPPTLGFCLERLDGNLGPIPIRSMIGLGRAPNNGIRLPESETMVSNNHLTVYLKEGKVYLKDLGSANGTWMGEVKVTETEIEVGQEFSLGRNGPRFKVCMGAVRPDRPIGTIALGDATRQYVQAMGSGQGSTGEWASFDPARQKKILMWFQRKNKKQKRVTLVLGSIAVLFAGLSLWLFLQVRDLRAQVTMHRALVEQLVPGMDLTKRHEAVLRIRAAELELAGMRSKLKDYAIKGIYSNSLAVKLHLAAETFGEKGFVLPDGFVEAASRHYQDLMSVYGRRKLTEALARKQTYEEIIHKELTAAGLPPSLIYLVMHESRFDPSITSSRGARGLWQLMPLLAGQFNLKVPSDWRDLPPAADPRTRPAEATKAGVGYLSLLFDKYRDPFLAMAAYNSGEPQLNSALRRLKASTDRPEEAMPLIEAAIIDASVSQVSDTRLKSDYWYLQRMNLLPKETLQYVPKIVATMVAAKDLGG